MRLDEKSAAGFAVISWHDQLHLAWTGNDMRINLASAPDGREITAKQRLEQRSYKQVTTSTGDTSSTHRVALAPSLAASGDRLDEARTRHAPALCSHQGSLIVAWSSTDNRLNLARLS